MKWPKTKYVAVPRFAGSAASIQTPDISEYGTGARLDFALEARIISLQSRAREGPLVARAADLLNRMLSAFRWKFEL
jgi:hypothetical protein